MHGNATVSGSDMKDSVISILSVNVCGLRSKLANHVFKEECCKHKICVFTRPKRTIWTVSGLQHNSVKWDLRCSLKTNTK